MFWKFPDGYWFFRLSSNSWCHEQFSIKIHLIREIIKKPLWGFGFIRLLYFVTFGVLDLSILSRQRKTTFSDNWLFFHQNPHEIIFFSTTRTSNWTKTSRSCQPCSKNTITRQVFLDFWFWNFSGKIVENIFQNSLQVFLIKKLSAIGLFWCYDTS